jgi:nitrogen fixation protein FixH
MTSPAGLDTTIAPAAGRPITGRMVFAAFLVFFGTIFVMNLTMLRLATSTFPGLETDSAYRAGQRYGAEAAAAKAQAERAWRVEAALVRDASGTAHVVVSAQGRDGEALSGLDGTVRLAHPADRRRDREAGLVAAAPGRFEASLEGVAPGQWSVIITFTKDGERLFLSRSKALVE